MRRWIDVLGPFLPDGPLGGFQLFAFCCDEEYVSESPACPSLGGHALLPSGRFLEAEWPGQKVCLL